MHGSIMSVVADRVQRNIKAASEAKAHAAISYAYTAGGGQ